MVVKRHVLVITILVLSIMLPLTTSASSLEYVFLVYGSHLCPHCTSLVSYLKSTYGENCLIYYDMTANNTYKKLFEKIVSVLQLPPNLIAIPFTVVICNNTVTGVVIGDIEDKSLWDMLISKPNTENTIPIYTGTIINGTRTYIVVGEIALDPRQAVDFFAHGRLGESTTTGTKTTTTTPSPTTPRTTTINNTNTRIAVGENTSTTATSQNRPCPENEGYVCPANTSNGLFSNMYNNASSTVSKTTSIPTYTPRTTPSREENSLWSLLFLTVSLAAVDSVNPCTIYLYTLLLIAASVASIALEKKFTVKRLVGVGMAFVLAVMAGYITLGLGLITILTTVPKIVFIAVGLVFGLWVIYSGVTGREKVVAKGRMVKLLPRASRSILLSALLGLLATFTLLPCSAGPYIVFTGIASKLPLAQAIPLLLLYNIVFVLPLILVLSAILLGISRSKIREAIIKHNRLLSIISGILLILVSVYITLTS